MQPGRTQDRRDGTTRALLTAGALAGPAFTLAWIGLGATRADYDPLRHPISSLAIGDLGWTQVVTFLATGLLTLAFAIGLRRRLSGPGGSKWGPWLIGLMGIGLIGAGLFVADPLNGYPPGTPLLSLEYTLNGRLHRLFSALVFVFGLPGACFVLARMFNRAGQRGWELYSTVTGVAFLALFVVTSLGFGQVGAMPALAGVFQRITLTVAWVWVTLLAVKMLNVGVEREA